jgi:hypothetical protein
MAVNQSRQPRGTSQGGEFSSSVNPESTLDLDEGDDLSMSYHFAGNVSNVQEGSRTPWGTADTVHHIAPGIVAVGTPGHGGVKLSPERNKKIPPALRNASGWYEEDCESYIPMMIHAGDMKQPGESAEDAHKRAELGVINWFPDQYEKAFSTILPIGASSQKDKKTWYELHADDDIAVSARGWGDDLPEGMVVVSVCRGGRGERGQNLEFSRDILVPKEDYDNPDFRHPLGKHNGSFVVDPSKNYKDVMPPRKLPSPPRHRYRGVDLSVYPLGSNNYQLARRGLGKQFRREDGAVESVKEIIDRGGIVGKSSMLKGNRRRMYYLQNACEDEGQSGLDTYALEVPKALWDAVEAPAS